MGRHHVQVVRSLGMEVVGLCDQSRETIELARRELGLDGIQCSDDARGLLRSTTPEAVVVATTAPSHSDLVCAAAESARYILCEKPIATSVRDADLMIESCARRGAVLAVNHQIRFMSQYTEAKAAIETNELGGLVSVLVAGSNFGLAMNGSHYFEMFRFITGDAAQSVQAWLDREIVPNPRGAQFQDRAGRVRVTGRNGISMYLDCSASAGHGVHVIYICRHGQILVDDLFGHMRIVRRQDRYRELPTTRYGMPAEEESRLIAPADVIAPTLSVWKAMLEGRGFPDGGAGRHALLCLCAAHTSDESGNDTVHIEDVRIDRARRYPWA